LSDVPQTAESAWQRREFARGIADGALAFTAPASTGEPLFSRAGPAASPGFTPAVTMAGLISQNSPIPTPWFKDAGDAIFLLGDLMDPEDPLLGLGGSAVLRLVHRLDTGLPPVCDFQKERELHLALRAFICSGVVKSAHDCAEGGLAIALLESCALRPSSQPAAEALGAQVDLTHLTTSTAPDAASVPAGTHPSPSPTGRLDAWLFGEAQARVIISVAPLDAGKVLPQAAILGIPAARIGVAGGTSLEIKTPRGTLNCPIAEIARFPNKPPELDLPESGS
jgi:phosphoribosylformylglycinamidine synthase